MTGGDLRGEIAGEKLPGEDHRREINGGVHRGINGGQREITCFMTDVVGPMILKVVLMRLTDNRRMIEWVM